MPDDLNAGVTQTTTVPQSGEVAPVSGAVPSTSTVLPTGRTEQLRLLAEGINQMTAPVIVQTALYGVFAWCLLGISIIYGFRFYNDSPIHPSFIPFVAIAFSAILSFAVVMAFRSVSGEIKLKFGESEFQGAAGPVLFWSICFISVTFGMNLLGVIDATKSAPPTAYKSCSAGEVALNKCSMQSNKDPSAPGQNGSGAPQLQQQK